MTLGTDTMKGRLGSDRGVSNLQTEARRYVTLRTPLALFRRARTISYHGFTALGRHSTV
ncbi:mis12-mtw1 family protein, partial [Moniliophthora roreri]